MNSKKSSSYTLAFWIVMLGLTLLRGVCAAFFDLAPDEAYYWAWSTQLDVGYYDHGPLVAWLMAAGTTIFGSSALGVRLGALLCSLATCWIVFVIARDVTSSSRQAFWLSVILSCTPIFAVGAIVHTPDAALSVCWSLSVWFAIQALRFERLVDWIGLGLSIGMAILAKMSGLLILFGLAIFLCTCKSGRLRLKSPGPALTLLLAVVVALPNLIWNSQNGGGSFAFQLVHAFGKIEFSPLDFASFLGGQAGVISPLLWVGVLVFMALGWQRSIRFGRPEVYLMWCFSTPILLAFGLLSMVHKVEANWPVMAYLAALPCTAWLWIGGRYYLKRIRLWVSLVLALAVLPTVLIHLQVITPFLPLDPGKDPTARLRGWRELAAEAVREADNLGAVLASEGYGPVSELRFYTGRQVYHEPNSTRHSQYDLWDQKPPTLPILFLQPKTSTGAPKMCQGAADRWELIKDSGQTDRVASFRWWVCNGAR